MIKKLRNKYGISQRELGELIGRTDRQVCVWEKDEKKIPVPVAILAHLLIKHKISVDELRKIKDIYK